MELVEIKYRMKLVGALLWIVGMVTSVWFGATFQDSTRPMLDGERSLCAFGMVFAAMAAGSLSLAFSYSFDGSKIWDWAAMSTLATAVIVIGLCLGDSAIIGASIGHAIAIIGGGIVGVMTPHSPTVFRRQPHFDSFR